MAAVGFWTQVVTPGKRIVVVPQIDLRLTNISFGENIVDEKGRTTIKFYPAIVPEDGLEEEPEFEKQPIIISHLTPGKIESVSVNIVFTENEIGAFEITGKNDVHLIGNYIDQGMGDDGDSDDSDEEGYDLEDVSSDVEVPVGAMLDMDSESDEGDAHRFEEVVETVAKPAPADKTEKPSKKRERESDANTMDVDGTDIAVGEKLSKKQKKKLNKKLKAEGGVAIPTGEAEKEIPTKKTETEKVAGLTKPKEKEGKDAKEKTDKKKEGNVFTTKNGVIVDERTTGTGPLSKSGQRLSMRYIGKLSNGKVFDKNTSGTPFTFTLGKGEVIKGWDEGLLGMAVGSERILTIPPNLAYGKKKTDDIPANSTLRFEVKLLSIK